MGVGWLAMNLCWTPAYGLQPSGAHQNATTCTLAPKVEPETPATHYPSKKRGIFAYILPYLIIIKHNEM